MRIGIVGGGQLAQMLALAGIPLGMRFLCLDPQQDCSASQVADIIPAEYHDQNAIHQLANAVDILTFESENIPAAVLQNLSTPLYPAINALEIAQDRLTEKQFLKNLGIPVADFMPVEHRDDLNQAGEKFGFPFLLKTRRQGYDGKGQQLVYSPDEIENIPITPQDASFSAKVDVKSDAQLRTLRCNGYISSNSLIAEKLIHFDTEVSLIAVRNQSGDIHFYPLTENFHQQGILRLSKAPFLNNTLTKMAQNYLRTLLENLNYVGVLTIEFFVCNNTLIANEIAPRVHNSGHWTIEGAKTSQFENHLRAILNLPLGETDALGYSAMVNFIGECPELTDLLKIPSLHVHVYGKTPKPGRKLGHVTLCANSQEVLAIRIQAIHLSKVST